MDINKILANLETTMQMVDICMKTEVDAILHDDIAIIDKMALTIFDIMTVPVITLTPKQKLETILGITEALYIMGWQAHVPLDISNKQ